MQPSITNSSEYAFELLQASEARTRTLEHELATLRHALEVQQSKVDITEKRSQTLEYLCNENLYIARYQADLLHKLSRDIAALRQEGSNRWFQGRSLVTLGTDHPVASASNDHLQPDSTTEGMVRPTPFVRHCIDKLGQDMRSLDLGTGAAGLVYEFARHGVLSLGVDGSDFNARHHVGYWPFIPENLFTCDITQPFKFTDRATGSLFGFDLITMWEVLEHIPETGLPQLLNNVRDHLLPNGYFLGSISLLDYSAPDGSPYHVTLQPRKWWRDRFAENGLNLIDHSHPFDTAFFCRGIGHRFQDVHDYRTHPEAGFHFIAQRQ